MSQRLLFLAAALLGALGLVALAQSPGIHGTVSDGVGRPIAAAKVTVTDLASHTATAASTAASGNFSLALPPGGYDIRVEKASFAVYTSNLRVGATPHLPLAITLDIAPMQQSLVVAATGVATPQTQLGQSVQVLSHDDLSARAGLTLSDSLQNLAGVQVTQAGAIGGTTSVRLRGADPSFTKILLDGVPVQRFDYGSFDFSTLLPAGLESATVVSGGDSVVYGSDAAAGVIDLRSRSGAGLATPELTMSTMAGSFDTVEQTAQLLGNWRMLDYGFTFGYLDTHNQIPNNKAWNQTWGGNVGVRLPDRTLLRLNLHRIASRAGDPNAFDFFGIADNSWQRQGETYGSAHLQQQTTAKWVNEITYSQSAVNYGYDTAAPTGTPFDPYGYGANYLGNPVTITGANGYSVQGQAILDYAGTYPSLYASDSLGRYVAAQSSYEIAPLWTAIAGYRYGNEQALTAPTTSWHNNGAFAELSGAAANRIFGSAGVSEDMNSRFGNTLDPQASLAFLPRLSRGGWWNEIRLHVNAATATKDPTVAEDQSSLFQTVVASGGASAAAALNLSAIHPQRAHTFDVGVDQYLANDQARLNLTWFDDRYDDLIEFVPTSAFPLLGISAGATAAAQAAGGAYLNSLSESSKGTELELQARLRGGWHASASYTYLVPVVLHSFSSDAVSPAFNPAFPTIAIGAYSPLVGARPFRVAPESGSIVVGYERRRWNLEGNAVASSRRDDSTFLSDGYLGDSMLLPNHDLAPAYTALNLIGSLRATSRVTLQAVGENLLNQNFQQTFGYPSLGRAFRIGVRLSLTKPQ